MKIRYVEVDTSPTAHRKYRIMAMTVEINGYTKDLNALDLQGKTMTPAMVAELRKNGFNVNYIENNGKATFSGTNWGDE